MSDEAKEKETYDFSTSLKVMLTAEELVVASEEMAKAHLEIESLEEQIKTIKSDFKAKIDAQVAHMNTAANLVRNKYEHKLVDCRCTKDYKKGRVTEIRLDTKETITDRKMRDDERQGTLDFGEEK